MKAIRIALAWIFAASLSATQGCFAAGSCLPKTSAEAVNAIGRGEIARLVHCGLDPNQSLMLGGEPVTPLVFAASLGKPEIVEQVIRAGADPNYSVPGDMPLPPLEVALSNSKYAAAMVLLRNGARGDYTLAGSGATALMTLAFNRAGDQEQVANMVRALIEHGAQLNAQDTKGNTALHLAARMGSGVLLRSLLRRGADRCIRNAKGLYPKDLVKTPDDQKLAGDLSAACPSEAAAAQPRAQGGRQ
ncbi:ankyrin repeat domain-containing protein [Ralstonia pseudosolanacearum]|uniref:ankyrin repeat domain-containing protein n=1 Tax=Ralstonia pseudosolanacearum TaxID=1310165 RepID=UPI000DAB4302|nr:ankyrin repeat domain-containing protein [Ralstonia pseudosolanacearum]QWQ13936.1 ankyrin repeat domain-containing protein [Ralstonia solanacearum]RAA05607.1 ankyrin repeat domain-containing protein [Ralstonia pseudosolanacearum]